MGARPDVLVARSLCEVFVSVRTAEESMTNLSYVDRDPVSEAGIDIPPPLCMRTSKPAIEIGPLLPLSVPDLNTPVDPADVADDVGDTDRTLSRWICTLLER